MKEQHFLIPPDLGQAYLLMGMTIQELVITIFLYFIAFAALLHGFFYLLLAPVTCTMLFIRVTENINLLSVLTTRINYFLSSQHYSLNPSPAVICQVTKSRKTSKEW